MTRQVVNIYFFLIQQQMSVHFLVMPYENFSINSIINGFNDMMMTTSYFFFLFEIQQKQLMNYLLLKNKFSRNYST